MPTIKLPLIVSTSGYNDPNVIWADAQNPPVAAVICRASIGTPAWMGSTDRATDQSFKRYWPQWMETRMPRSAYHFLMNQATGGGVAQAKWFLQCVNDRGSFKSGDQICLDVEDYTRPYSIREVMDFWNYTLDATGWVPEDCLIYSRDDIMNPLALDSLSASERDILRRIRQWPAIYPNDPDSMTFSMLAAESHFDYAKYGPVALVQYMASAIVDGISKPGFLSVECNVADPEWLDRWVRKTAAFYGGPPVPVDVVTTPYPGVTMTTGRRYDSDFQMVEISKYAVDPEKSFVTPDGACKLIETIPGDVVANGGDFDMTTCKAVGLLVSKGVQLSPPIDFEPALYLLKDGASAVTAGTILPREDAVGLKRYLVINGVRNPNTSDAWLNREPRTIYGATPNGDLLILSVKGRQADQAGMDLFQCAMTMLEFGAWTAGDGDGGDSTQARVAEHVFEGTANRRAVADFVSIVIKQGGSMAKYKCTVTWDGGAAIRPEPSTSNSSVGSYTDNAVFYASALVADQDDPTNANKQWAVIESDPSNGTRFAGKYVAVKYPASSGAVDRATVEDLSVPPPPTGESPIVAIEVIRQDGTRQRFVPAP